MRTVTIVAVAMGLFGCGKKADQALKDTLTTRERQEAIGTSGIPGARGINRALDIVDTATARIQGLDTVGRG